MITKIYLKYTLFLIAGLLISCNQNATKSEQEKRTEEIAKLEESGQADFSDQSIEEMNESASAILQYRIEQDAESYAAIEMDRWFLRFLAEGSEIHRVPDGQWLDFYPDLTYEYGNAKGTNGKGRYHYRFGDGMLLMVDDDKRVKPKEFEAKINGPVMVLVGKPTYKDNHIQMKFEMDNVPQQ